MNRFEHALNTATALPQPSLLVLAETFLDAIKHVEAEGQPPEADPAVLVLGSFIAFHTHADVNTVGGYRQLLNLCAYRAAEDPGATQ